MGAADISWLRGARRRFLIPLALVLLLGLITLLVRGTNDLIVQPAFERLERLQAMEDATRAWRAIQKEIDQLGSELSDWSNWDDTYAFAETRDPEFLQANLGDWKVLSESSGINLCVMVGRTNEVLYAYAYDFEQGGPIALDLIEGPTPPLLGLLPDVIPQEVSTAGILNTPQGLMLLAARPILNTSGKGPARGAIVFGRMLNAAMIASLSEQTRVAMRLLARGSKGLKAEERELLATLPVGIPDYVVGERGAYVYQVLTDMAGERTALLGTPVRREISMVGRQTGRVMALALILAFGGVGGLAVLTFLGMGGLISGQTRRDLGAEAARGLMGRHTRWLGLCILLYVMGVMTYAWWAGRAEEAEQIKSVDRELLVAAQALRFILPEDFHDRAVGPGAIPLAEERQLTMRQNRYLRGTRLANVYTVVDHGGRFYFTAASVNAEQQKERASWFFYPYDEAPVAFRRAHERRQPVYVSYRDRWGEFRSVAVPERSPGGSPYLACADYDMHLIREATRRRTLQTGLMSLGFLVLALPFLLVYRKAFGHFAHNLRLSEASYRGLFDAVREAIFIFDRSGLCLAVNAGAEVLYGRPRTWFEARTLASFGAPDRNDLQSAQRALDAAFAGTPQRFEFWGAHADGHVFLKDIRLYPGTYNAQHVVIAMAEDITERRRVEAERIDMERHLQHTQKLESLGVLAGGIAHDFNNLLMAMLGNLDLALGDLTPASAARTSIDGAIHAARRAADLTRQLLAYSGRGKFIVQPLNLTDVVNENVHLFRASIAKTITLDLQLTQEGATIEADAAQMQQIVMNLIINAAEAIGQQVGTITIRTGVCTQTELELRGNRTGEMVEPGRFAFVEVIDSGCGMEPPTLERLFEPFYSTKGTGRGLGMPAVLGIVRAHRGAVFVESTPGKGTRMRVYFPVMAHPPEAPVFSVVQAATLADRPETGAVSRGIILVVDDEVAVCELCARMIQRLGYAGLQARDGREAVALYRQHWQSIVVVLMDLSMPNMDGVSAHKEMLAINPAALIILCSGYSEQDATQRFVGTGLAGFVQKPYDVNMLRVALERALKAAATRSST